MSRDKVTRANPFRTQVEARNVALVRAPWNRAYLSELADFPVGIHDDQVDASSGSFNAVALEERPKVLKGGTFGRGYRRLLTAKKKNSGRVTWGRRTRRLDKNEVYLSVTNAATKYGFHPKTIRKWIHCGAYVSRTWARTAGSGSRNLT